MSINRQRCLHWQKRGCVTAIKNKLFCDGNIVDVDIQEQVDVVLSMLVLHHLSDIDSVFKKIKTILEKEVVLLSGYASTFSIGLQRNMGHVHLVLNEVLEDIALKHQSIHSGMT